MNIRSRQGFTLIELLIVVAIIAILAAIAVPNFLEAQVRAKVSRAKADLRTITTGIESYYVDNNRYPYNPDATEHFYVTPDALTTPVAYLTSRPIDPFKINQDVSRGINPAGENEDLLYDYYTIVTTDEYIYEANTFGKDLFVLAVDASGPLASTANRGALEKYGRWLQWSIGPDALFWNGAEDFNNPSDPSAGLKPPAHLDWGYSFDVPYDPTNGTVSFGNIVRCQIRPEGSNTWRP
jgi:type II secretion system protein G